MMKFKVKPEGRDGVWLAEEKNVIAWLKSYRKKKIHNFLGDTGAILIGVDWDKKAVVEKLEVSNRVAILTGAAFRRNMRHALSVIAQDSLYMFDIGEITEDDLEITE